MDWCEVQTVVIDDILCPSVADRTMARVRVRLMEDPKKRGARPARVAGAGQANIPKVHAPKRTQHRGCTCGQGRRAMGASPAPHAQFHEGEYALKVSMSCSEARMGFYGEKGRTDHQGDESHESSTVVIPHLDTIIHGSDGHVQQG